MRWLSLFKHNETSTAETLLHRSRWRPFGVTRAWKAAKRDRLTADWLSAGGDINQELKSQLSIIRLHARELEQNSKLARSFLSLQETHIVGPEGFALQVLGKLGNSQLDKVGTMKHKGAVALTWCVTTWIRVLTPYVGNMMRKKPAADCRVVCN